MDRERLQFGGRLREKELEVEKARRKAVGLRETVRLYLDPFVEIEELDVTVAFQNMAELVDTVADYRKLLQEIKAIKKALGQ